MINRNNEYKVSATLKYEKTYLRFTCLVVDTPSFVGCSYGMDEIIILPGGEKYTADRLMDRFEENVPEGYWESYHWDQTFLYRKIEYAIRLCK